MIMIDRTKRVRRKNSLNTNNVIKKESKKENIMISIVQQIIFIRSKET